MLEAYHLSASEAGPRALEVQKIGEAISADQQLHSAFSIERLT
jgi:hypothetical protein